MQVRQLFDNQSSTYTYLVWDEASREAAIIDAVIEQVDRDVRLIHQLGLQLRYALETHIHADHITGSGRLREYLGCEIGVHLQAGSECADLELVDGDRVQLGSQHLEVIYTPGHTDTDICLLGDNMVFTGDILLIHGSGRTDFQSGDAARSYDSITGRLFCLPDQTRVYPAHDYNGYTCSTIGEERQFNPRLGGGKSRQEYIRIMESLALDKPKLIDLAVPGNQVCGQNV
ncbi:MAG: MBL fold metallo-hydrolase [Candidatus Thiodiazotropha sp. (ex Monitilora ramsayi)]|nr:MBL fold metallo-hydrolase [Candidatus Thiodiazotropha sp. (ex Monitilora ramsayi)]